MPPEDTRLDEHGRRLDAHDERLNIHSQRFDKLDLVLQGDERLGVPGLVRSIGEMNATLKGLIEWRDELIVYAHAIKVGGKIALIFLGLIVGGVWFPSLWPQILVLIKLIGG